VASAGSEFKKALASDPVQAMIDFACVAITPSTALPELDGVARIKNRFHSGLAHYSTHICTLNSECTKEMVAAGFKDMCGACAFAVKGVDHLEAIEVKIFNGIEEIRALHEYADSLSSSNQHELQKIDSRIEICTIDLLAWVWCRDHLISALKELKEKKDVLFSYRPEILRKALVAVELDESSLQYVMSRLYQNSFFPELQVEVVRAKYKMLRASILGNKQGVFDLIAQAGSSAGVAVELVSLIKSVVKSTGCSLENFPSEWAKIQAAGFEVKQDAEVLIFRSSLEK
jgi:hypothetical protein